MPTPYGSRGGLAFGAEELRVLRRALAHALNPSPVSAEDAQDCRRLAESLDEAARESARLRAFLLADLARYRAALPGTAAGYLTLLDEALCAGHRPHRDDLAALRALSGNPTAAALLTRCRPTPPLPPATPITSATPVTPAGPTPTVPAARTRLLQALPGGRTAPRPAATVTATATATQTVPAPATPTTTPTAPAPATPTAAQRPAPQPDKQPAREPAPRPPAPKRPVPTPGEVFPRRKPAARPATPGQHLAAG
ncbi:hypothetical protein [Streptomyces fumanus]|uniref:Uncharacterized protein n=1 Tax=Streptomyces fumanus TaxID=67302 RepID=A0A919A5Q3_9ACTN|nr:hypothetical protein [Streptomyces fumanus]GHE87633.1 hypothetical protein GCM10018772_08880 [Streptomyces fumanus]